MTRREIVTHLLLLAAAIGTLAWLSRPRPPTVAGPPVLDVSRIPRDQLPPALQPAPRR